MGFESVFEMIATNGIFAVLFFFLLMMEIKDSRAREQKYQDVVSKLTQELHVVNEVNDNVDEVLRRVINIQKEQIDEENK